VSTLGLEWDDLIKSPVNVIIQNSFIWIVFDFN
jgi:hypothetical protein